MSTKTPRSKTSEPAQKVLILIRHAHRDTKTQGREIDNGLSSKGRKQAKAALKHFKRHFKKSKPWVISSPKLRCVQTVEPIARYTKRKLEILPLLDEGADTAMKAREFLKLWQSAAPEVTVLCSHGDWIPDFLKVVTGGWIELDKGGWATLETENGRLALRWLLQNYE